MTDDSPALRGNPPEKIYIDFGMPKLLAEVIARPGCENPIEYILKDVMDKKLADAYTQGYQNAKKRFINFIKEDEEKGQGIFSGRSPSCYFPRIFDKYSRGSR